MNDTVLTVQEQETARVLLDGLSSVSMAREFVPPSKLSGRRRTAWLSIPAVAAAIVGAIAITSFDPGVPTPAGWASVPTDKPTLTPAIAIAACTNRALEVIDSNKLPGGFEDTSAWLTGFFTMIDERGDRAVAVFDHPSRDYAAACVLSKSDDIWRAQFFATRGHQGRRNLLWADTVTLSDGRQLSFVLGETENDVTEVTVEFATSAADSRGATDKEVEWNASNTDATSLGYATHSLNHFAIWLPESVGCRSVKVHFVSERSERVEPISFGGTDGISRDQGICD